MTFLCFMFIIISTVGNMSGESSSEYLSKREQFIKEESACSLGGKLLLNSKETVVNDNLMKMKVKETMEAKENDTMFPPATHFFHAKSTIDQSPVYKLIQRMPKGGALHVHDAAMVDVHWVVKNATYDPHCYMCESEPGKLLFHFFPRQPTDCQEGCSPWVQVTSARENASSPQQFDQYLYERLTLIVADPLTEYPTQDVVWRRFSGIFLALMGLYSYVPVFKAYYLETLRSFYADNVHYMEIRTLLPKLYELDGTVHDREWSMETYTTLTRQFAKVNSKFIGAKIIFTSIRAQDNPVVADGVQESIGLLKSHPEMFAGYDLVGQEDPGHTLLHFLDDLLYPSQHNIPLRYFFHAGETDWQGLGVDDNLLDAILLNTTRIGHGYAAPKHPKVLEAVREREIAIEVNPISNQVLKLVSDLRNHAMVPLIAQDYPIVISSDDPALWGASPLSHDFYEAFMGLGGARADLRMLKQLAINSLKYSAMNDEGKKMAMDKWQSTWDSFVNETVQMINGNL